MAARSLVFGLHHTRNGIGNSTPGEISLPSHSNDNTNGKPIQTDRQDDGSDPGLDDDQCSTKSMTDDVLNYQYLVDRAYHSRSFRSIYWYAQSGDPSDLKLTILFRAPNDELQSEAMGLWSGQSKCVTQRSITANLFSSATPCFARLLMESSSSPSFQTTLRYRCSGSSRLASVLITSQKILDVGTGTGAWAMYGRIHQKR